MNSISDGKTVDQIESLFWKNITFSSPLYGADIDDTWFDLSTKPNINSLNTILELGTDTTLKGINKPYLYVGTWKSLFAWHKEDFDLAALNYLHYGKPKFWYVIHSDDGHILEKYADSNIRYKKCN